MTEILIFLLCWTVLSLGLGMFVGAAIRWGGE